MYFKTISLHSVPIHVLADHYTTFLTLFNSSWLYFSFVSSYEMSSFLKYLSILHGWFFLSVILWFRVGIRIGCFFLFQSFFNILQTKKRAWNFLCSTKEVTVHNLSWPVVSRVIISEIFSSTVCSLSAILNDVICHKSYAQQQSCYPCDADI